MDLEHLNQDEFEALLRRQSPPELSSAVTDSLSAQLQSPTGAASGGRRVFLGVLAIAASLLLVMGLVRWYQAGAAGDQQADVTPPDRTAFLFLDTESGQGAESVGVIHKLDDFKIVRRSAGDKIFEYTVQSVKPDGLDLEKGGEAKFYSRADLSRRSDELLRADVAWMQSRVAAGALAPGEYERLEQLALMGRDDAVSLLQRVSEEQGGLAARARSVMGETGEALRMRQLSEKILDSENRYRENMMASLSRHEHPVIVSALTRLVENADESESVRLRAVDILGGFQSPQARAALQACQGEPGLSETVRAEIRRRLTPANEPAAGAVVR